MPSKLMQLLDDIPRVIGDVLCSTTELPRQRVPPLPDPLRGGPVSDGPRGHKVARAAEFPLLFIIPIIRNPLKLVVTPWIFTTAA